MLNILLSPDEDAFGSDSQRNAWRHKARSQSVKLLAAHRQTLIEAGFSPAAVTAEQVSGSGTSVARTILDPCRHHRCATVVVGRHGISRAEEFMFGSVLRRIISTAKDLAVWAVA